MECLRRLGAAHRERTSAPHWRKSAPAPGPVSHIGVSAARNQAGTPITVASFGPRAHHQLVREQREQAPYATVVALGELHWLEAVRALVPGERESTGEEEEWRLAAQAQARA